MDFYRSGILERYTQSLDQLHNHLLQIEEAHLWQTLPGIGNSSGNLLLHICGNLRHFIGANLGNTGYIRNRELEFSTKDLSKQELLALIAETRHEVIETIRSLPDGSLESPYPTPVGPLTDAGMHEVLIHLHGHLQYHLGQSNYLGRLLSGQ